MFAVLAMCLTNVMRGQFYDSADEICFYVEWNEQKNEYAETGKVLIFNFDGEKAAKFEKHGSGYDTHVKEMLKNNPNYYEELVETTEYKVKFVSSSPYTTYTSTEIESLKNPYGFTIDWVYTDTYQFSSDRQKVYLTYKWSYGCLDTRYYLSGGTGGSGTEHEIYKRVPKSFFRVGRQRTPSNRIIE